MSTPRQGTTPAPERSLNRQVVLDEDEYTEALSHIIARDFFPSLVHLDATNEYLDALQTRDPHLINASVRRLEEVSSTPAPRRTGPVQTPSQTPYAGGPSETPLRTPRGEPFAKKARYDTNMSLDNFQARYTSEDNSSFTEILDDENRKRREKWAWAWEAQKKVEQQRGKMIEARERRLIEAPPIVGVREKLRIEVPTPAGLITDGAEAKGAEGGEEMKSDEDDGNNKALAIRQNDGEEEPVIDVMAPQKDTRSAGVDGWEFKVCTQSEFTLSKPCSCFIYRLGTLSCSRQMQMSLLTNYQTLTRHRQTPKLSSMATHVYLNNRNPRIHGVSRRHRVRREVI